mgnify:CR=1 FL=1
MKVMKKDKIKIMHAVMALLRTCRLKHDKLCEPNFSSEILKCRPRKKIWLFQHVSSFFVCVAISYESPGYIAGLRCMNSDVKTYLEP